MGNDEQNGSYIPGNEYNGTNGSQEGKILSVRAFLENEQGNILLLKRGITKNSQGKWSFPGGTVYYTESPENGLERLVKDKTGLTIKNLDFLNYQNSPRSDDGLLHCLNMYFKANAQGDVKISNGFTDYAWVEPKKLKEYQIAFMGNDAIAFYEKSKIPTEEQLWSLVDEAGLMSVPITKERLIQVQALPGFFVQLKKDIQIYEQVRRKMHTELENIQSTTKRSNEPIIVQIQSRDKSYESIIEKMIRKGHNGIPRHYTTFDDMCGVRAVVSFLKDVYTIKSKLLEIPELKLREEKDNIKNPREDGYRALHLTFEVTIPGASFVPRCEVQIKTIYQHSWSNATHELTYKKDKIPKEHIDEFRKLSDNLASADEIAEKLRHDIEHLDDKPEDAIQA